MSPSQKSQSAGDKRCDPLTGQYLNTVEACGFGLTDSGISHFSLLLKASPFTQTRDDFDESNVSSPLVPVQDSSLIQTVNPSLPDMQHTLHPDCLRVFTRPICVKFIVVKCVVY